MPGSDDRVIERVRVKENWWKNSLIITSLDSAPPEFAWTGELTLDENSTAFGSWENISNPSWHGYCVFHVTREGTLVGFTIVTQRGESSDRSVKEWTMTRSMGETS
jgi:hypothetical protein